MVFADIAVPVRGQTEALVPADIAGVPVLLAGVRPGFYPAVQKS